MSDIEDDEEGSRYTILYEGDETPGKAVTKDGVATATFANGDTYTGMYKDQKRNGRGVYKYAKGMVYDGEYVNNKKEGQGTMVYSDTGKYTGEWKANTRHGFGTYIYPNGDSYSGEWKDNKKSGQGKYVFADNGSTMSGSWVSDRCVSGVWGMADKSRYVGRFANNVPAGSGLFVFANGNKQAGAFADNSWNADVFTPPLPTQAPPAPQHATPLTWSNRAIEKSLVVVDHFEGINQIEPVKVPGVPNLRQAEKLPVWGGGQPTLTGIKDMMAALDEEGFNKLFWVSLRDTPVCYVNDLSFTSARKTAISRPMQFTDIKFEDQPLLDGFLNDKLQRDVRATGGLMSYWKLAPADKEDDVKRVEIVMEVQDIKNEDEEEAEDGEKKPGVLPVRTVASLFAPETGWVEQNEAGDITYSRMQIGDHTYPSIESVDALVNLGRELVAPACAYFQDQGGFDRTTNAMIMASLMRFLFEEPEEAEEEPEEQPQEEEPEEEDLDEDMDEEEREQILAQRAAAKAERARQKAAEEEEEEVLPDYKAGEYKVIKELVAAIGKEGEKYKQEVDMIINRNAQLTNFREIILAQKDAKNIERGQDYLERYFMYFVFYVYCKQNQEAEFEKPYSEWLAEEEAQKLVAVLGTREAGALAEFNWT